MGAGTIEVALDGPNAPEVGKIKFGPGKYCTISTRIHNASSKHDLYLRFKANASDNFRLN